MDLISINKKYSLVTNYIYKDITTKLKQVCSNINARLVDNKSRHGTTKNTKPEKLISYST